MATPVNYIKTLFPIFAHRPELVYLDNAATSQKPHSVIDAITRYYEKENANTHRGLYDLSSEATRRYEEVRKKVAALIGARDPKSIAFTKGTTESLNIVATGYLRNNLRPGDNVVVSAMEHHANLIPWQQVCAEQKASLRIIPVTSSGELNLEVLHNQLDARTKMVAVTHISNVLGSINPIEAIAGAAHKRKIPILVDAAQSVGHYPVNVSHSSIDFLAFSAHKMFGPMGTGVLYVEESFQEKIRPLLFGGGSIRHVEMGHTEHMDYPYLLEAGTPHVPGVIGLGSAIDFLKELDLNESFEHEKGLSAYFKDRLLSESTFTPVGNPAAFGSIVSFVSAKIHPHDIASYLASCHIAVRAGHHCCEPLMDAMAIPATVRVSFSVYNTKADVDQLMTALAALKRFWA